MDIEKFKQLFTANFAAMNINTLEYYLAQGEKLICNMVVVDPVIIDVIAKISDEIRNRG